MTNSSPRSVMAKNECIDHMDDGGEMNRIGSEKTFR